MHVANRVRDARRASRLTFSYDIVFDYSMHPQN